MKTPNARVASPELLFSVTASDCEWSYTKGRGAGGQKKNKTSSAVHSIDKAIRYFESFPKGFDAYSEEIPDAGGTINEMIAHARILIAALKKRTKHESD